MVTSIDFEGNSDGHRILVRRRTWDGIDRPEYETLYTIETIAEAAALYKKLGTLIETMKSAKKVANAQQLEALKLKLAQMERDKRQLEAEIEQLSRP